MTDYLTKLKEEMWGWLGYYDKGDGIFLLAEGGCSDDKNAYYWKKLDDVVGLE